MYLKNIHDPADVKKLNEAELSSLASEMRSALIEKTSAKGGHLASNLGIVELTIALHYVFESPSDKIVFDVSHQTYCHKMLTGRAEAFLDPDKYESVSGYSNPYESSHDFFNIGHTSTSISLACGFAKARDLRHGKENVIAVIGDSSLDGGEAFEGLNLAGELGSGLIVVVNDNDMSIPENHGTLNKKLNELRASNGVIEDNYFKSLGFEYLFVRDGHSIPDLIDALKTVKGTDHPVVVHVCTKKGKGYEYAEKNPEKWHWSRPFDVASGEFLSSVPKENYGAIVREFLLEKMKKDPEVVVVAASTPICIGFDSESRKKAGRQYVDVGIAEQNAVTFTAALAKAGAKPVFATNSTFYQRAYDQIEQEMCISHCPATMIVTHASVSGHTNDTHAGLFDIPLMGNIPYLTYLAPTNKQEYLAMLDWSLEQTIGPVAIRTPWTAVVDYRGSVDSDYSRVSYKIEQEGSSVAIIALGSFFQLGEQLASEYEKRTGIRPTLINPRFINGVDAEILENLKARHEAVVTLEDSMVNGGFGARIAQFYGTSPMKVKNYGFTMDLPINYNAKEFMRLNGLTPDLMADDIISLLQA